MSRKEKLLKEIDTLRERRRDWFNVLFALSSAILALVYAVIGGDKPLYVLILAGLGFVALVVLMLFYKTIESTIETKLNELEKEE
jgi:hypothetical protein